MHHLSKPRAVRGQFTASSPATPFLVDDRPALTDLQLPGPRREKEGRGGATANLVVFRTLIRGPLLKAWTAAVPAPAPGRPTPLPHEGENPIATRVLRHLYDRAGHIFPVLTIDGVGNPGMYQDLTAEHGIYVVNAQPARAWDKGEAKADPANAHLTGTTIRRYGVKRDQVKLSYDTPLGAVCHEVDGVTHQHHLVADDGAVYETDRPGTHGSRVRKLGMLKSTQVERRRDADGKWYLLLTLTGNCTHGGEFTTTIELRWTKPVKDGRVPWRSTIANVRVIPEALAEKYALTFGKRNQIESFFSWLEKRFYFKDRHASWGREAQLLDLVFAALLHNTETWAHLAYRHPAVAGDLADTLADLGPTGAEPVAVGA